MGHHILISCTKFVFLFKRVSPLSLLIWALSNGKHPNFFRLLLSSPSLPFLDRAAFPREEAHPSCQSRSGTLFRIVRGFVSKVNEVAETTNICQRGSNLFQLLETGRHSSASRHHARAVSALAATKEHTQRGTDCLLCMVTYKVRKLHTLEDRSWRITPPPPLTPDSWDSPAGEKGGRTKVGPGDLKTSDSIPPSILHWTSLLDKNSWSLMKEFLWFQTWHFFYM